jgi:hypothetical protein
MLTDDEIRRLIAMIDHFHGNELKERSERSILEEVQVIKEFLKKGSS